MTGEVAQVLDRIHGLEASLDLDALIRREIAARKDTASKGGPVHCPSCGANNPPQNKFCAECGSKLNQ
jgi:hypothetical protein